MNAWEFLKGIAVSKVIQWSGYYTGELQVGGDDLSQTAERLKISRWSYVLGGDV